MTSERVRTFLGVWAPLIVGALLIVFAVLENLLTITATLTATTFVLQEGGGRGGRGAPPPAR